MNLHERINNTLAKPLADLQDEMIVQWIQVESAKKTAKEMYHTDITKLDLTTWTRVRDVVTDFASNTNSAMVPVLIDLFDQTVTKTIAYNNVPDVPTTYPLNENIVANPLYYAQCIGALKTAINATPGVVGPGQKCEHISAVRSESTVYTRYYFCFDYVPNTIQLSNLDALLSTWMCP
jgi:hypothetical protein